MATNSIRQIPPLVLYSWQINSAATRSDAEKPRCILGGKVAVSWKLVTMISKFETIVLGVFGYVKSRPRQWNNVDPQHAQLHSADFLPRLQLKDSVNVRLSTALSYLSEIDDLQHPKS